MEIEKLGGGLMNAVLGGLILWVAQTTFHHSGELAGISQKFDGITAQHENLQSRLDGIMSDLDSRTQSRFTSQDGEKLQQQVTQTSRFTTDLERRLVERLTGLQLKIIALETQGIDQREIARLRSDLERVESSFYSTIRTNDSGDRYLTTPAIARRHEAFPQITR